MLTDEDIDCIVQDISDAGGATLGSIEKPSAIDAIQKHVEESLLFLDEEKSILEKSMASHEKSNIVLEKPGSDDTLMQDVDGSLRHIEIDVNNKNTEEPVQKSTGILKEYNINDTLPDEQQKDKIEIEGVTTENQIKSLLEYVEKETINIPEQMETNDNILSVEDNPITDSVLNETGKDTAMNHPQEETSGISEHIDTSKVIVSQEDNLSDSVVHAMNINAVLNVSLEQKSEIPQLPDNKKTNIESLEDSTTSDSVLNEINTDAEQKNKSEIEGVTTEDKVESLLEYVENIPESRNIPEQMETKDEILSQEYNPITDSVLNETGKDTAMNDPNNDSEKKSNELSMQSDDNKVCSAFQEDNPSSISMINERDRDASMNGSELKSSDISEQSTDIKVCNASQEDNPSSENKLNNTNAEIVNVQEKTSDISIDLHEGISRSDSLLDETDVHVTMNYDSQYEIDNCKKQMITNEISNISQQQKSPSDSLLKKTDLDANIDDTQESISEIPQQNNELDDSNDSQEKNPASAVVLDINVPQEETCDISEQIDINEISNISQENNNRLNETDTESAMQLSEEIPEQIEINKVNNNKYKILNETDGSINDSQDEISDISELIDSKEVSIVSQENIPSDSVFSKTDTDATINDSQEEMNYPETFNIDDSSISEKDGPLNSELNKTDAVLHEGCETDYKTIETASDCQDNLKCIKKDHENSVTEPQKYRTLVESKDMNNQTDESTQIIENTTTEEKERYKLPELESIVEKTGLPENETQVNKEINETEKATQQSPVKELVWEIKSINHETEQQGKKESCQAPSVTENQTKNNPLVRAVSEDFSECPPAKRTKLQPVWTTNRLNDEATCVDKTAMNINTDNVTSAKAPVKPYIISQEYKKILQSWLIKSGIAHPRAKYMSKLFSDARKNKAVLRMAPIPKEYKIMDVFRVIRNQTESYEKEITKNIQFIHIDKFDDNFNAAYIKWRDIDKLLVVKAYQILVTTSFTVDGVVKQPLFKYDDRSVIDWNGMDRPRLKQKDGSMVVPLGVTTPAPTPAVTPISTVRATTSTTPVAQTVAATVAKPVAATVAKPAAATRPSKPPPPSPFVTGEYNAKDRQTFGLTTEFLEYYNIRPPILCIVLVKNLDISYSVDKYYRIFSAAGEVDDIEVMPPPNNVEQTTLTLKIAFSHVLEAVQAISMFHEQILFDRLIEVEMASTNARMKRRPLTVEGFSTLGPGIGSTGQKMRNIRSTILLSKLRGLTKLEIENMKVQLSVVKQKLSEVTFKLEKAKKDQEKRKQKEEKKQIQCQNESQNQTNIDAVSAITKAIASSVQANVISILGIQPNQQGQNMKQTPSAPVSNQSAALPQNQNTPRAPLNWTANEITTTALPNPNIHGQTSMINAFQNLGGELQSYQNPQDPYSYYASMQQAYAQYGYKMDAPTMQANAYVQPNTFYMQPAIANVPLPVPAVDTANMPPTIPKTQSMPTIVSNQPVPSTLSKLTQSKVHTQSKTVFPPLPTTKKNVTVYDIPNPPIRFEKPRPNNVANTNKTTAPSRFDVPPPVEQATAIECKVPEIPMPIPTISRPAIKMAFKTQKPIVPPKETKPVSLNMKIPPVLSEPVPFDYNPYTLDRTRVQKKNLKVAEKLPPEPWINKQIREMKRNSKSSEIIPKSPEKIKSPDRTQKTLPKVILPPKSVRRLSRSPERRRTSKSPDRRRTSRSPARRNSRSPIRRRSRSLIRRRSRSPIRRVSRSPIRRMSRSPIRRMSRSPIRRMSRSPIRRMSRSPIRRMSRSPIRRMSRSPIRRMSRSPIRRRSRSPIKRLSRSPDRKKISRSPIRRRSTDRRRMSRSPKRRMSRSPIRRKSRSPIRRKSKSPIRRKSKSPIRRRSRSPKRRISKSPKRRKSRSPVRKISKSPVRVYMPSSGRKAISRSRSSELGPKPTPRPAYEPGSASRDITNMDLKDRSANYNYIRPMKKELTRPSVNFSFLPPSVTTDDLTEKMGEIGELLEVRAFGMGKALVVFKYRQDAETCIEMYNMAKVDGQTIEVTWASIK